MKKTDSTIITGKVMHQRVLPCNHGFEYPVYYYKFNLKELLDHKLDSAIFGYNKNKLVSIFDKDYLRNEAGNLKEKLISLFDSFSTDKELANIDYKNFKEIYLVTNCRYIGFVFNPVSFFLCYDQSSELSTIIVEINNTFEERHTYILTEPKKVNSKYIFQKEKCFHVSPFFSREGEYKFRFSDIREKLDIAIDLVQNYNGDKNCTVFTSRLFGEIQKEVTTRNIVSVLVSYPVNALLTIPRIYWQAIRLYFQRRLPVFMKPDIISEKTIYARPYSWIDQISMKLTLSYLNKITIGRLSVIFPDNSIKHFGDHTNNQTKQTACLKLNNFNLFKRLIFNGSIGFGESYVDKDWDSPDLSSLLKIILNNWHAFDDKRLQLFKPIRILQYLKHLFRKNSLSKSKKNIAAHYDIGNDLFKSFLDPSLMYSSGVFNSAYTSLEDSQKNKISKIIEKAKLQPNDHVLEIGSGWGSFAIDAVKSTNCKVTSITLSEEQLELARERAKESGVSDRVNFKLQDYRTINKKSPKDDSVEKFDKIVSIEMIEAVGKEYLVEYFKTIDQSLKENGIAVIQAIIFPHTHYKEYCKRADWIQEYIFPGSHLPTFAKINEILEKYTSLIVDNVENFSVDYARTLAEWRETFTAQSDELKKIGYDEKFQRMWEYYLASCEAEFATRWLQVLQIVLVKPNNLSLAEIEAKKIGYRSIIKTSKEDVTFTDQITKYNTL